MSAELTPYQPNLSSPSAVSTRVWIALRQALWSQCHPKMLLALLLPLMVFALGVVVLSWLFWTPLSDWLSQVLSDIGWLDSVDAWLLAIGFISLKAIFIPLCVACIIFPSSGIIGLLIAAVFVMPIALGHVQKRYPNLTKQGHHAFAVSVANGLWVSCCFVVGWLLTLPFWLLPPLGIVLSTFWWTFAFTKLLRLDSMVEHANANERKQLLRLYRKDYWVLGFTMALLNLLPPAWLVLPVYSALVFAHFSLRQLQHVRHPYPHSTT